MEEPARGPMATLPSLPRVLASWELRVLARESLTWWQVTVSGIETSCNFLGLCHIARLRVR